MPVMPNTNHPETIVAFDFGLRRIGVAVGQNITASANPIATIRNSDMGPDWQAISTIVNEWRPARLIVGMPLHKDGLPSDMIRHINQFIGELECFHRPVETVDESYSSLEAGELLKSERTLGLRGRINKEAIDSMAAMLIAERWLGRSS
jgi:putative Holliday junction resolvase